MSAIQLDGAAGFAIPDQGAGFELWMELARMQAGALQGYAAGDQLPADAIEQEGGADRPQALLQEPVEHRPDTRMGQGLDVSVGRDLQLA